MASQATGKAAGFLSFVESTKASVGAAAFATILKEVPEATRKVVEHPPMPMTWLPISVFYDMIGVTTRVAFGGRPEGMFEIGRHQMQRDMTGIYKMFVRMASPQTVIAKAAAIYGTYTTNGTMSAKQIEPHIAEVTLDGVEQGMPGYWEYQRGTITGVLEQTAKDLNCELIEGGGEGTRGVYRVRWRPRR